MAGKFCIKRDTSINKANSNNATKKSHNLKESWFCIAMLIDGKKNISFYLNEHLKL